MQGDRWFNFRDLRGGRNGGDPPLAIGPTQVNEALNIDYSKGMIAHKRGGATSLSLTFSAGGPFASGIKSLFTHLPGADQTQLELWAVDGTHQLCRLAGATTWTEPTPKDAITGNDTEVVGVSFNDKLFIGQDSAVNRAQVWDGTNLRRHGLAPPTAVPTATTAAGAVSDTRKYRSRVLVKSGSDILRRSEGPNGASSATVMAAQQATITLAGAPSEGETHWEVYGATIINNYATYHYIGEAAIGNTIVDNNPSLTGVLEDLTGTYLVPPSYKYAVADDARIVMAGAWETTTAYGQTPPKKNRVWWTPVLGDKDVSDDERVVITTGTATVPAIRNYLDVTVPITGLGGPIDGSVYVFGYRRFWRFSPTGEVTAPYRRIPAGVPLGCIHHKSICLGEDEHGRPALYFASHLGIYRIGPSGLEFCGWDIKDIWDTVNLSATVPCHMVYHSDKKQLWVYIATGSSTLPDTKAVFHTRFGRHDETKGVVEGWTKHTGDSCGAACSVMFANTVAASMSLDLKPYVGLSTGTTILKADTTDLNDNGTTYQAYLERALSPPVDQRYRIGPSWVLADASATTLRFSMTADFGAQTAKTTDRSIAAVGAETKVWRQFEDSFLSGVEHEVTVRVGDAAAIASPLWTLEQWEIAVDPEQDL